MQDFIAQFGDYAPLIFLLLASILPIFLFPPGIFSIIGGYLFGFKLGAILTIAAAIVYTKCYVSYFKILRERLYRKISSTQIIIKRV